MEGFRFDVQTCLYFGRYAVKEHQEVFDDFGKKAVIVTSVKTQVFATSVRYSKKRA